MSLPSAHQLFLDRSLAILQKDQRLLGISMGGSYLSGQMDEYSDVDLILVMTDDDAPDVMEQRQELAGSLGDLLVAFTGEHVGDSRLLICLYDEPFLHVDLKFMRLDEYQTQRVEDPYVVWERDSLLTQAIQAEPATYPPLDLQWLEDRFWVWIHYGTVKLQRGEMMEARSTIAFLQERVLAPMAKVQQGHLPRGFRFFEREIPEQIERFHGMLSDFTDPAQLKTGFTDAANLYQELRADLSQKDPSFQPQTRAEQAVLKYLQQG